MKLGDILGDALMKIRPVPSPSPLHKFIGKDIFLRSPKAVMRENTVWNKVLSHIRRILQDEYLKYTQARAERKYLPLPKWEHVPAQHLLDLQFSKSVGKEEEWIRICSLPWILLEIGETDKRNIYMEQIFLSLEASRRVKGNSTWVFTKRADSWLQERYGSEVMEWLNGLAKVNLPGE